jgi:hypothetical protein
MCPRKTFVIDVIIQELLIRRYWVPMKLDAVGLIANVENMKNPDVEICSLIEYRMSETIQEINKTFSIFESDKLRVELRILDWIFYQVCSNEIKRI